MIFNIIETASNYSVFIDLEIDYLQEERHIIILEGQISISIKLYNLYFLNFKFTLNKNV